MARLHAGGSPTGGAPLIYAFRALSCSMAFFPFLLLSTLLGHVCVVAPVDLFFFIFFVLYIVQLNNIWMWLLYL
jgi:hypothetical protein